MTKEDLKQLNEYLYNRKAFVEYLNKMGISITIMDLIDNSEVAQNVVKNLCEEIENNKELLTYFKQETKLIQLFKAFSTDVIRDIIGNREKYGLSNSDIVKVIKQTGDTEFIKEIIKDNEKYGLGRYDIICLIEATGDTEFIKKAVEEKERYGLYSLDIANLIKRTGDIEYIKKVIKDKEEYGLYRQDMVYLIREIGDIELIKEVIKDKEKYGVDRYDIVCLIEATGNTEFIKGVIEDKEKYGLHSYEIVKLAKATENIEFIKKVVKEREKYRLDSFEACELAVLTRDIKLVEEIKKQYSNIDDFEIARLLKQQEDGEFAKKLALSKKNYDMQMINLPKEMTIGIEIEAELPKEIYKISEKMFEGMLVDWKIKNDSSLRNGSEFVSPVLNPNDKAIKDIYDICNMIRYFGYGSSERCGGHIHIGTDYLKSAQSYMNLLELWGNTESLLYVISNDEGVLPRKGSVKYATPISKQMEESIANGEVNLQNATDIETLASQIKSMQPSRYFGINFLNIGEDEKNTIEFRLPNGTVNPDVWVQNINLFGGIIQASEELSIIQQKPENERGEDEKRKIELFEQLKSGKLEEEKKLEILLELVIPEEDRQIYKDRYGANSKLLEGNPELKEELQGNFIEKGFKIKPKEIAEKSLAGNEPILGQEYAEVTKDLSRELEPEREQGKENKI